MAEPNPRSIAGRVALITGAASGMGRATAKLFASEGAQVALIDIDAAGLDVVARDIAGSGGSARVWPLDLAHTQDIAAAVDAIAAELGGLDIVVNNAGITGHLPIDDPQYDELWQRILATNLSAQHAIVRAALPHLGRSSAPRIVNIASTEALGATSGFSAYSAAKAGVVGLTRSLAVELGPRGITVNCICPGPILTAMTEQIPAEDRATFARRRTALRRYGEPEEVAHMILNLCLPASSYVTGAIIPVDGGLMARNG